MLIALLAVLGVDLWVIVVLLAVVLTRGVPATINDVRHALEHSTNLEISGGLGFGHGDGCWYLTYRERMWDTSDLLGVARDLHQGDPVCGGDRGQG